MPHEATVVHQISGRFRVRIPSARKDREYFARVRQIIGNSPGVEKVETNYLTGSVLVIHSSDPELIQQTAAREGLFELSKGTGSPKITARLNKGLGSFQERLNRLAGADVDLEGLAFLGLAIGGGAQMLKKNIWPAGVTLVWYAANILQSANKRTARLNGRGETRPPEARYIQ
jgi:hypothetical protein